MKTVFFDFFGTLVDYSRDGAGLCFDRSRALVRRMIAGPLDAVAYEQAWARAAVLFDGRADHREVSMHEVGAAFLGDLLDRPPAATELDRFVEVYVDEWSAGVRYLPGLDRLLADLARDHRLAVVTNTHHAPLVPGHLAAMGVRSSFAAVVTSVEVGWRKPDPRIYAAALDAVGADAATSVFVGDTYGPDFLGPSRMGMRAFLIDPDETAPVPAGQRLLSIFDLPARLAG